MVPIKLLQDKTPTDGTNAMGIFSQSKNAKISSEMDSALRKASKKDEGVEPLIAALIEEVRLLRQELAEERERTRQAAERPGRR